MKRYKENTTWTAIDAARFSLDAPLARYFKDRADQVQLCLAPTSRSFSNLPCCLGGPPMFEGQLKVEPSAIRQDFSLLLTDLKARG